MPDASTAVHLIVHFFTFVTISQNSGSLTTKLSYVGLFAGGRESPVLVFSEGVWDLSFTMIPIDEDSPKLRKRVGCWEVIKKKNDTLATM